MQTLTLLRRISFSGAHSRPAVITSETGTVVERLSYDAWGKRRFPNGADDTAGSIESLSTRGFTGHEQLDSVGLVHMNGRVYDPMIGRMISPDPIVPDALNGQAWNRYSYVGNDPLTFTDPSGHSWFSEIFRSIANFFKQILANPIVRAIVTIVAAFILQPLAATLAAAAGFTAGTALATAAAASIAGGAASAIITGLSGGNIGQMLRAGAIAGATAFAFNIVGTATLGEAHASPFEGGRLVNPGGYAANIAGHAAVGCVSAAASGGKCKDGALSAAVGAAATPLVNVAFPNFKTDPGHFIGGTLATGAIGGLASVAGGGKFENGAVTAAFGYMYNNGLALCVLGPGGCAVGIGGTALFAAGAAVVGGGAGYALWDWLRGGAIVKNSTLEPGPHAGDSIPARGPERDFTPEERERINEIGRDTGCHTCGSTEPGTQSGNFIPDHQPASGLNPTGGAQRLYPHCLACSRKQGGEVRAAQ